jgi:hypothetical protein
MPISAESLVSLATKPVIYSAKFLRTVNAIPQNARLEVAADGKNVRIARNNKKV